jgi:EpsI family protein
VSRTALPPWISHFLGTRAYVDQAYARGAERAAIQIGYYRGQEPGAQMVSVRNALLPSEGSPWKNTRSVKRTVALGAGELPVIESRLASAYGNLLVWHWYWVDGRPVVNPYWAKLLQAQAVLAGRGDDAAVVMLYAPYDMHPEAAERTLHEFAGAMLPAISRSLDDARRSKPVE